MAEPKFNRLDIARKAGTFGFGLAKTAALKELAGRSIDSINFGIGEGLTDEVELQSYLGTPIYDTVTFGYLKDKSRNNYIDQFGNTISFDPLRLTEVIISVQQTKNIVATPIAGRNGTIKQYVSDGDYIINVTGSISGKYDNNSDEFKRTTSILDVERSVKRLVDICKIGYTLPVSSKYLNIFGIAQVVVTDYNMNQREGFRNKQIFSLNMFSDFPETLIFTEEEVDSDDLLSNILP